MERALYIDAGDIIFDGDIEEFYFSPFEGNFMIASIAISKRNELYTFDDISVNDFAVDIAGEYVNSGSLVLNLTLMRIFHIDLRFYENVVDYVLSKSAPFKTEFTTAPVYYYYDQGLLALSFVGQIKFWGYEYFGYQALVMPYNFRPFLFEWNKNNIKISADGEVSLPYEPHIIHLLGNKPWKTTVETYRTLLPVSRKYLDMFWAAEKEARSWRREYSERN
jgi:lipopolysaccharide biosynthesis glycosyltransferase